MNDAQLKSREMDLPQNHMRVDWRLPLPVFILLLVQTFGAGVWATNLQNSVTSINEWQKRQDDRLQAIEIKFDAVVERNASLSSDLRQFIYRSNTLENQVRDNLSTIKQLQDALVKKQK